mgnify:CR=1 FL=1
MGESDAEVQIGSLRVRARLVDLVRKGQEIESPEGKKEVKKQEAETSPKVVVGTKSPGLELNLRGKLVEDGLDELERYLEKAYSAGLLFVRIVHGKGLSSPGREPVLKRLVLGWLAQKKEVLAFCQARTVEGGAGAVIVLLAAR